MRKWLSLKVFQSTRRYNRRFWSSHSHVRHVTVPCASAGEISVSLYNISLHPSSTPLVICLPPFGSSTSNLDAYLPASLRSHPTTIINYRWTGSAADIAPSSELDSETRRQESSPPWPNPVHDVLFGYSWITKNLKPANLGRRNVYIYGSYLGATLGAALALTECHANRSMAVRGLITYNGIFNWTMFLPDHPVQKIRRRQLAGIDKDETEWTMFQYLRQEMPFLFHDPANLFDPFASPSLLLHSPALWVPSTFTNEQPVPLQLSKALEALSLSEDETDAIISQMNVPKAPGKGYLKYPPRESTLEIPETLLLHERSPLSPALGRRRWRHWRQRPRGEHNFEVQARELVALLRRSLERSGREDEAKRKIHTLDVGPVDHAGLSAKAQHEVSTWLTERLHA